MGAYRCQEVIQPHSTPRSKTTVMYPAWESFRLSGLRP